MKPTIEKVSFSSSPEKLREYAKRGLNKQIQTGNLSESDSKLILEFVETVKIEANISASREYKLINTLSNLSRFFDCGFTEAKIPDLYAVVNKIKSADKNLTPHTKEGKLSQDTQRDYIQFLKRFYFWMIEENYVNLPRNKIEKIKLVSAKKMSKTSSDMLSEEDILKLITDGCSGSTKTRDQALISVLYEGAFRIHEVAKLTWGDVDFSDRHFLKINTDGKTGIPRYIPLTVSREYLCRWRSEYPDTPTDDKPIFISNRGKSFTYAYLKKHLADISKQAGVKKFNPHVLRHSRVTNLAKAGYSETVIKMMCWGTVSTDMFSRYAHLIGTDINREFALRNGFELDEDKTEKAKFTNKTCGRCHTLNPPSTHFCSVCGEALDEQTALELEDMKSEIHEDIRYKTMIDSLLKKIEALEAVTR